MFEIMLQIAAVGAGATLVMDLWGLVLRWSFGVTGLDYRLVGRWIGHLAQGQCNHNGIGRLSPVPAESLIGWVAHYAIGIVFAGCLVVIVGVGWLQAPAMVPALLTGLITVAAPFLILQPALGLGVAASRTPNPAAARIRSLVTHLVFGVGLYVAGRLVAAF